MLLIIAIWLQLADPRETEISGELFLSRLRELHDAPLIQEVGRLPPFFVAEAHYDMAWLHLRWLEDRAWMAPDEFGPAITVQRHYADFWANVLYSHRPVSVPDRRWSMKCARQEVGLHAWIHRDWPGPMPDSR